MSQRTHESRMKAIRAKRGRTPAKAVGRFLEDPLRKGVKLFEIYGTKITVQK